MDGVMARDVGRPKVSVVQASLRGISGSSEVAHPLPDCITTLRALLAVKMGGDVRLILPGDRCLLDTPRV